MIIYEKLQFPKSKIWLTSDTHAYHKNICRGTSTWEGGHEQSVRDFDTPIQMTDELINQINKNVKEDDLLIHLGDWSFDGESRIAEFRSRIICKNIYLVYGNHDHNIINKSEYQSQFLRTDHVMYLRSENLKFFISHYPHYVWHQGHHGVIHLYGHCIDIDTEILTNNGWKTYETINYDDLVYSSVDGELFQYEIKNIIINKNDERDINVYDTKILSMGITNEHRMFDGKNYITAENILKKGRYKIPVSGYNSNFGIRLSDDLIRLYIYLVADGSYNKETNLARLRAKKEKKIKLFRDILKRLDIVFSDNVQKDGCTYLNFKLPNELMDYNIKGLDKKLMNISTPQFDIILEAYTNTDGCKSNNSIIIYTSKKEEADLLQAMGMLNQYKTTISSRIGHGHSKKESYQICFTWKYFVEIQPSKFFKKEKPKNNITWCIETEIGNFVCRRKGKAFITGNCHSSIEHIVKGKMMDVGVDNIFKLKGEYRPINLTEIEEIMSKKDSYLPDHHQKNTN